MYEDKASIKLVRQQKGWGDKRICKEFPNKNWAVRSVTELTAQFLLGNFYKCVYRPIPFVGERV